MQTAGCRHQWVTPKGSCLCGLGGTDTAHHLPFLETNWEVTPASNVAKTGLWSLVMMSLVLPAGEGSRF